MTKKQTNPPRFLVSHKPNSITGISTKELSPRVRKLTLRVKDILLVERLIRRARELGKVRTEEIHSLRVIYDSKECSLTLKNTQNQTIAKISHKMAFLLN